MAGRLERIEDMLRETLGSELLSQCPELAYAVSRLVSRFGNQTDAPATLWRLIDSQIFNAAYDATGGTMLARLDGGKTARVSSAGLRDLSDRLLAVAYDEKGETPALRDALFDLSRAGSLAAMRTLLARYALDETERELLTQVLMENERQG